MAEAQPEQDFLGTFPSATTTQEDYLLRHVVEARQKAGIVIRTIVRTLCHKGGQAFLLALQGVDFLEGRQCLIEDGAHRVGDHLLRQVADRLARGDNDGSALGLHLVRENLHQRGLPRSILTYQADAVAVVDVERDVVKKGNTGKLNRQVVDRNHVSNGVFTH